MPTPFLCNNCTKPTMNNSCICNDCELAYIGGTNEVLATVMELENRVRWLESGLKQIAGGYSEYAWGEEAQAILDGEPTTADEYNNELDSTWGIPKKDIHTIKFTSMDIPAKSERKISEDNVVYISDVNKEIAEEWRNKK